MNFGQKTSSMTSSITHSFTSMGNKNVLIGLAIFLGALLVFYYFDKIKLFFKDKFSNVVGKDPVQELKELNTLFFFDPNCEKCQKMIDIFIKEKTIDGFEMVDVTSEKGKEIIEMAGIDTWPTFVSLAKSTGTKGMKATTQDIIDSLNMKNLAPQQPPTAAVQGSDELKSLEELKSLDVVFLKMNGCGHCERVFSDINNMVKKHSNSQLQDYIQIIDIDTPEAKPYLDQLKPNGFPTFFSKTTGKVVTGGKPVQVIINELK